MRASYIFTSESVSEGHPDKVADQISDAVVDLLLATDHEARVACETMVTTQKIILSGELRSSDRELIDEHGVDRKSVGEGKSVSVGGALGGGRLIKKKK